MLTKEREHLMKHLARSTFVAGLLALVTACAAGNANAPSLTIPEGAVEVAWSDAGAAEVAHQYNSGFTQPARTLIDNQSKWAAAWATLNANSGPKPAVPAIDFNRYTVIVAALGRRNTGGYDIRVSRLATSGGYLYVEVTSTSPGNKCGTTQALTEPVHIIRVAKPHAPLVYIERASVTEC